MKREVKSKFLMSLAILSFCIVKSAIAQTAGIAGTITEEKTGNRLNAVSVLNKRTHNGTISNTEGAFGLQAHIGDTIIFSGIGFQTYTYVVGSLTDALIIRLRNTANDLNDVVVTALGISKTKRSIGYATQEVKSEELTSAKSNNLVNGLAGKIAGVRITNSQGNMGSSRIVIRGETSIANNNQPLFILDGIPVDNSQFSSGNGSRDFSNAIADINPEDIASINVLKGPTAAALYGSRAAHGVLIITTKSGKKKQGLGITVNSNEVFDNVLVLPDYQNVFGQGANGQFSYVDGAGNGVNDAIDESWGPKMDGQLIAQFGSDGKAVPFIPHPDNVRSFFKTGITSSNSISLADAGDKYAYHISFNNLHETGITPNSALNKRNFSLNVSYQIAPKLTLTTVANYFITDAPNLPGAGGKRATSTMLQFIWNGRQVDFEKLKESYFTTGSPANWNNAYYPNPYFAAYQNTVQQRRDRLTGDAGLKYQATKELNVKFHSSVDYYTDRRKLRIAYGTSGTPYGSYEEDAFTVNENNTELLLTYDKNIAHDFSLNVIAGGNIRNNTFEENDQQAPRLAVPGVYTLNNSRDPLVSDNELTRERVYSVYGSAQLGYKSLAYINATARNDWSSTLPVGHQSYFYPSVSGTLVWSELLKINRSVLSYGKLRAGWAKVGADASPYQLFDTYTFSTPFKGNPQLTSSGIKNNPDLKSETTTSTELGLEAGFFQSRITLDVSAYNTNSYNQILNIDVTPASGYDSKVVNAGKIRNRGIEVQLGLIPVKSSVFQWNIDLNYAANRSKVLYLDKEGALQNYLLGSDGTVQVVAAVGQPYGTLEGITYQRDAQGRILIGADGLPGSNSTLKPIGSFQPKWIGGISNSFSYKRFGLNFLIDASIGGNLYSGTNATGEYTGVLASTLPGRDKEHGGLNYYYPDDDHSKPAVALGSGSAPGGATVYDDGMIYQGVTQDGNPNQQIISASQYYKAKNIIDEEYIYKSSYVKFRELRFSYSLPVAFLSKLKIREAVFSIVGRNLWILHKDVPNVDPETAFNTGNAQGLEDLTYPTTRSFGFNLNLKF